MPVLFLTVFLDLVGFGIVIPLLPFFAQKLGADAVQVTILMASYSLMQFLFAPFWGRLSDRLGRRPVLLISIGGSILGLLLFAFAQSYLLLLVARLVHGAMNANIAVAQAYISDVTTPQTRAKGMGLFGAAFGLGFIFGPGIGGFLGNLGGHRLAGLAAAGLAALNLLLAFLLLPESRPEEARLMAPRSEWRLVDVAGFRLAFRSKRLGTFLLVGLLSVLGFAAMESTFALWSKDALGWSEAENGYLFTYLGVLIAIVQGGLVGPLRNRYGEPNLVMAGLALLAVGLAALPFSTLLAVLLGSTALLAIGNGLLQPNLSALVSLESPHGESGRTLGLYQSLSSLGRILGPLAAGAAYQYLGIGAPFLFGAMLMVLALALLLQGAPNRRKAVLSRHA